MFATSSVKIIVFHVPQKIDGEGRGPTSTPAFWAGFFASRQLLEIDEKILRQFDLGSFELTPKSLLKKEFILVFGLGVIYSKTK